MIYQVFAGVNMLISLAYIGNGIYFADKFRGSGRMIFWLKIVAGLFFLTCAWTHLELALHAILDRPEWMVSRHFIGQHVIQAGAGLGFLLLAHRYVDVVFASPASDKPSPPEVAPEQHS